MKNNISLDINHPQKTRVEFFLNNVEHTLEPIPFDVQELSGIDEVEDSVFGCKFKTPASSTSIIVIFTSSYFDAAAIETANRTTPPAIRWTINGPILFGVQSDDERIARELLSFFAGKE